MQYPLFDFKDFSDISDFDFMYHGNNIMVNKAATNLSKVDAEVKLPPPLVKPNEQTEFDPMNLILIASEMVNSVETNQFNSHIGSSLPEDGVYTTQSVYLKRKVNLVKFNNLNGHIGSSLPKDGVYIAKSVYLECKVNSLQEKTLNGHVGSSLQDELLSCSTQREDLVNPGKRVTFANQFQQNNGNNNSNGNQQPLVYPNSTPQNFIGDLISVKFCIGEGCEERGFGPTVKTALVSILVD
ncbi:hypothetical protein Golob_005320, partial [Gossypium lobatum]|nr:hypothetical protein [Gossypium lobatum]